MTSRLRLVQLVHGYPPAVGGVEFAIRDICEALVADHGVDVTVLTTNAYTNANFRDGSLPTIPIQPDEVINGVRVRRFPVRTRWSPGLRVAQKVAWELRLPGNDRLRTLYQGPISPGLKAAAVEVEADVIGAASFPLNHLTYPFRRPVPRPPVVLFGAAHPADVWGYARPHLLRLTAKAFATVALTEYERQWLVEQGAPRESVHVIPLGIDPERVRGRAAAFRARVGIPSEALVIGYVGQQGSHKGIDLLIAALPRLLTAHPEAWLVVAGSRTPYSAELRRLAATLPEPAHSRVIVLDDLDEQGKADLLAGCDIFASPSRYESFGITVLEAWAQSRPVLVGEGPAQRCVVEDAVSGLLVMHDVESVLAALLKLAGDPGLRRRLGVAGRSRLLERFTLARVVADYHGLLLAAREAGRSGR